MKSYKHTTVNYLKTQAQIGTLLSNYGIKDTRHTTLDTEKKIFLEFLKKVNNISIPFRIEIPNVSEKNRDQLYRGLFYFLKSKFESVEMGLKEFTEEFFPYIVIGNKTMYETLAPKLQNALESGKVEDFNLLPEGKD